MARVKSPAQKRHRVLRSATRGMKQARRRRVKAGKEALIHAGQYAYAGRKLRKRDMRALWVVRLNAAVRENGLSYSKFISLLKTKKIELDRKMLAEVAATDANAFKKIVSCLK